MNSSNLLKLINRTKTPYQILERLSEIHFGISDLSDEGDSLFHLLANSKYGQRSFSGYSHELQEVVSQLQANPNIKNNQGETALGLMLQDPALKNMTLITALINHPQFNADILDQDGNNYLQSVIIASHFNQIKIAQLLIHKTTNIAHRNKTGKSAFDLMMDERSNWTPLLLQTIKLHPTFLLDRCNGKSIISELLQNDRLIPECTTLLQLCKSQDKDGELIKEIVNECFGNFRQDLVSEFMIFTLTKALIETNINIDTEYCLVLTVLHKPSLKELLVDNFKKLKPQIDSDLLLEHLKNLTSPNSDEYIQALSSLQEFLIPFNCLEDKTLALEELLYAQKMKDINRASKMFGHLFALSGSIPENKDLMRLTGIDPVDTAPFMVHLMNAFVSSCELSNQYKEYLDTIRQVRNITVKAMRFCCLSNSTKEERLLSMLEDSKNVGVEIIAMWPKHTIDLVLRQDDFYRHNGGGCSTDTPTEHYKITKPYNTKDMFSKLINDVDDESNKIYIQRDLHHLLGLTFVSNIPGDFQIVGNCSFYSLLLALKTKYRLFLPEDIADSLFTDTVKFFEQFYLEEYLSVHQNNPILPHLLMRLIIQKLMPEDQTALIKGLFSHHFNTEANQEIMYSELMLQRWKLVTDKESTEQFDKQLDALNILFESLSPHLQIIQRFLDDKVTKDDLVEVKSWPLARQTVQGYSLLQIAVINNNLSLAASIIQMFPNIVNQSNWYDEEPLCLVKSVEMIDLLINAGASVSRTDDDNALDCAIQANRADLVSALLKHNAKTSEYSAYYAASKNSKVLQSLVNSYPETVTKSTYDYRISIHAAAEAGNNENINTLVYYGAHPNASDVNGITPLQLALKNGHQDTAKLLMEYPGTLFKSPHRGDNVIKMTQDEEIKKTIELKKYERKTDLEYFETTFKNNPLGIIKDDIDYLIIALNKNDLRAIRGCLLAYPNIKVTDSSNHYCITPLASAIQKLAAKKEEEHDKAYKVVKMLLKTPAININATQPSSEPLLFMATAIGDVAALELFLADPKLDPNKQDNSGYTALHDAVERGHLDCVQRLLADQRVDSTITNIRNQTAAELESFRMNSQKCKQEVLQHQQLKGRFAMNN